ncbi:MAG: acetoin dehydrogenase dihydrolipoyllysine-residue acetyltransferase subunit [Acetobacteraceae bacterium]
MADIAPLTMPKLGLSMTEGEVAAWHKAEGDRIEAGEEVADIETPKITTGLESPAAGTLRRRVVGPGESVAVGALIGVLADAATPESEVEAFISAWQERFAAEKAATPEQAAPEPERVATPFGPVQVLEAGPADAPPLVLLHGFGADLLSFLLLQPLLATRFRTIAVDLPGHGGSTKNLPGPDPASLAKAVGAAMSVRGIQNAHLVGHSLGGAVALALTAQEPERSLSLTLISPAGLGPEVNADFISGFLAARRPRALAAVLAMLFADEKTPIGHEMIDAVLRAKRLDGAEAALAAIAAANFSEGRQKISLRPVLADPARPARIVWGRHDRIIPASHAEGLPAHVKVTIFENAGHVAHIEKPEDLARLI